MQCARDLVCMGCGRAHPTTMGIGQRAEMEHLCTKGREEADVSARLRYSTARTRTRSGQRAGIKAPGSAPTDEGAARMLEEAHEEQRAAGSAEERGQWACLGGPRSMGRRRGVRGAYA